MKTESITAKPAFGAVLGIKPYENTKRRSRGLHLNGVLCWSVTPLVS
jgi:hypothetical protein